MATSETSEDLPAAVARHYWRALVENAISLIEDATCLADKSPARARSLLILAHEEIGKAKKLYGRVSRAWSKGQEVVTLDARFISLTRKHDLKIAASIEADEELDPFWGAYVAYEDFDMEFDDLETWFQSKKLDLQRKDLDRKAQARALNLQKQAGFYVDRVGRSITTPTTAAVEVGDVRWALTRAAQVVEMLLISDHTRMQDLPVGLRDSTMNLQQRVSPYSHLGEAGDESKEE